MATLQLNLAEKATLKSTLAKMEAVYGADYSFEPEINTFSCKCSGPAQSCVWH